MLELMPMTESDWNTCTDPQPMLEFLRGKASDRKLRLFAVAYCHHIWPLIIEGKTRHAIEVAEQFADGLVSEEELDVARTCANEVDCWTTDDVSIAVATAYYRASHFACCACSTGNVMVGPEEAIRSGIFAAACYAVPEVDPEESGWQDATKHVYAAEHRTLVGYLRDIFGPLPFRSVALDPSWLSSTVTSLATAIYEEHAFDRLPILADALEDAGCTNPEVLTHLRSGGEHCRGCWPLDLVLGRE
jgi:hypothetical protein